MLPSKNKKKKQKQKQRPPITGNDIVGPRKRGTLGYRSNPIAPYTLDQNILGKNIQRRAGFKKECNKMNRLPEIPVWPS